MAREQVLEVGGESSLIRDVNEKPLGTRREIGLRLGSGKGHFFSHRWGLAEVVERMTGTMGVEGSPGRFLI